MPPERTKDKTASKDLKPYSHPKGKVQFYEEDETDIVTLVSSDGYAFKVLRVLLIQHSQFWKDFLGLPARNEPIQLEESSSTIYTVLHMLHEYEVDRSLEPDPQSYPSSTEIFSPLGKARKLFAIQQILVTGLIRKWMMRPQLQKMFKDYALLLAREWGACAAGPLFTIACQNGWQDLCKGSIQGLGSFRWVPDDNVKPVYSAWEYSSGLPFWLSTRSIEVIGLENYKRLVRAVAESQFVPSGEKIQIDWSKVAEKFKVESKD